MDNKVVSKDNGRPSGDKAPSKVGRRPGTKLVSCTLTERQYQHLTAHLAGYSLSNWLRSLVFQVTAMPEELREG